ncbi:uncharacterized protein [Rutidosis leptorrhynchoides]|uniref:uncharacterized protein n=1 Tax=Rutidosis leptorrhynchoides TaxID=125765 RepID=UPI003A996AE3
MIIPLYYLDFLVYSPWKRKNGSVSSHFTDTGWHWSWRIEIRGVIEESQFNELLYSLNSVALSSKWWWDSSPNGSFSASIARKMVDVLAQAHFDVPTYKCNIVPIKINICIWRLKLHRLATLRNLDIRDLVFDNTCCGLCDFFEESHSHLFVRCDTSYPIWCKIGRWLDISIPKWNSVDEIWNWIDSFSAQRNKKIIISSSFSAQRNKKIIISSIVYSTFWNIWHLRNRIVFKDHSFKKAHVFDSIVFSSFNWLFARYHKSRIN